MHPHWNNHIPLIGLTYDGVCLDHMSFSFPIVLLCRYAVVCRCRDTVHRVPTIIVNKYYSMYVIWHYNKHIQLDMLEIFWYFKPKFMGNFTDGR